MENIYLFCFHNKDIIFKLLWNKALKDSRSKAKVLVNIHGALLTSLHRSFQWLPTVCRIKCLLFSSTPSLFPRVSPRPCTEPVFQWSSLFKNTLLVALPTCFHSGYLPKCSLPSQPPASGFRNFINTARLILRPYSEKPYLILPNKCSLLFLFPL